MRRTSALVVLSLAAPACLPGSSTNEDAGLAVAPGWVVEQPFDDVESLNDVVTLGEGKAYAVGTGGTIVKASAGVWAKEDGPTGEDLESIDAYVDDAAGITALVAVGAAGTILLGDGEGWRVVAAPTDKHLFGAWIAYPELAYAVGEGGTIVAIEDGAARVMTTESLQERTNPDGTVETYPIPEALKAIGGYGGEDVVAVGARGAVYHYDGTAWLREDADTSRPLTDLFSGAGIWSTTTEGIVLYRNGFDDWDSESHRVPSPVFLQGIWTDWSLMVAVGFTGALFVRQGGPWESVPLAQDVVLRSVSGVVVTPATEEPVEEGGRAAVYDVYAVGGGGRIVRGPTALPAPDAGTVAP